MVVSAELVAIGISHMSSYPSQLCSSHDSKDMYVH